ncbi:disulfide bond formation protein DsbD, partial [Vibrio cholerae O1 biovar El Tor]
MLWLSLVVVRCQPLRRALCLIHKNQQVVIVS